MPINEASYEYGGARALVALHEEHLRAFVRTWQRASAAGVVLPPTEDATCASLGALLRHVLGAAGRYMEWTCRNLGLPGPGIAPLPDDIESHLDEYLAHVLGAWDGPLTGLDQRTMDRTTFESSWGVVYCIDAMLEHAVMHPIRHSLQLERALAE